MANFTEDGNATSTLNQTVGFARTLPAGKTGVFWLFLFAINIVLSFTAFLGNALILIALRKVSSLHPPSKLLFGCLAVTDLVVGLISQPLFAIVILGYVIKIDWNVYISAFKVFRYSASTLCGISILTSTAISLDRLLVLLLGVRYKHLVTLRRVRAVIFCFCFIAVLIISMNLFLGFFVVLTAAVNLALLSLVISVFSYTKIFLKLRQKQAQVQAQEGMPLNVARYKKTVSRIAWVQFALVGCYVPFIICVIVIVINGLGGMAADIVWYNTVTLVYFNSSLNPLLYCWKIKEVRQVVKGTMKQFCCCLS